MTSDPPRELLTFPGPLGRFRDLARLGAGGMGVVYRARDTRLRVPVALKLLARSADDPERRLRFERELSVAIRFHHPNLVAVVDGGVEEGVPFIAMELLSGATLEQLIRDAAPLPWPRVAALARGMAAGLACLHEAGVVHRDVKPSNVMALDGGGVKLLDFGLARPEGETDLTMPGGVLGTLPYVAPELLLGEAPCPGADLWSLGCVLYELLTGGPHHPCGEVRERCHALARPFEPPSVRQPGIPRELDELVVSLLAFDPGRRPRTAAEVEARLNRIVAATPPTEPLPLPRPAAHTPEAPDGYEVLARLGGGGMGEVFRVAQRGLRREVALKVLRPGVEMSAACEKRFEREARAMGRVSHPGLVKVFDAGRFGDRLYIVLELVPGRTLQELIDAEPVQVRRKADLLFGEMLSAVAALHAHGLTHRDIKPANVMITPEWKPVLLDLGLVKDLSGDGTTLTRTGALLGTPAYLAPEVLEGAEASPAADVWALGCIYHQLWAGAHPFPLTDLPRLYEAIRAARLPDLDVTCPDLDAPRRAFLARLMSRDVAVRPRDAREALVAFNRVRREPSRSRPTGKRAGLPAPASSRKHLVAAGVGLMVCALAAFRPRTEPPEVPPPARRLESARVEPPPSLVHRLSAFGPRGARLARWLSSAPGAVDPPRAAGAERGPAAVPDVNHVFRFARDVPEPVPDATLEAAIECVSRLPDDGRAWLALGQVLARDGHPDAARVAYRQARGRVDGLELPFHLWPGMFQALEHAGELEARAPLLIRADPDHAAAWVALARYFPGRDRARLRRLLDAAISDPASADGATAALGVELIEREGRPDAALELWSRYLARGSPASITADALSNALMQRGRVADAIAAAKSSGYLDVYELRRTYLAPGPPAATAPALDRTTLRGASALELGRRIARGDLAGAESYAAELPGPPRYNGGDPWLELVGAGSTAPATLAGARAACAANRWSWAALEHAAGALSSAAGAPWMDRLVAAVSAQAGRAPDAALARALWHSRRREHGDALEELARAGAPRDAARELSVLEIRLRALAAGRAVTGGPEAPASRSSAQDHAVARLRACVEAYRRDDKPGALAAAREAFALLPDAAATMVACVVTLEACPASAQARAVAELTAAVRYNGSRSWLAAELARASR